MKPIIFANKASTIFDRTLNNGQVYSDEDINTEGNIAANLYDNGFIPGKPISPILLNTALRQISTVLCGVFAKVLELISASPSEENTNKPQIYGYISKDISSWDLDTIENIVSRISAYLDLPAQIINGSMFIKNTENSKNYISDGTIDEKFKNIVSYDRGKTQNLNVIARYFATSDGAVSEKTLLEHFVSIRDKINNLSSSVDAFYKKYLY